MSTLRIHLLGSFKLCRGDQCRNQLATAKVQQLLGYLCTYRHRLHSRDALAEIFWGGISHEQARGSLRTCLWRLRRCLELDANERGLYLIVDHDGVGFNTQSDYWLDLEVFEEASHVDRLVPVTQSQAIAETIARLTTAVDLYRGTLLEGCYEDWCVFEQERIKDLHLRNLSYLMLLHRRVGSYADAIRCGQTVLSHDPLLEEVHRELMHLHCLAGNRGSAIRQYQSCRQLLRRELDIEPMEETTVLYADIVAGREHSGRDLQPTRSDWQSLLDDALIELRSVQSEFDRLGFRLRNGVATFEALQHDLNPVDRG